MMLLCNKIHYMSSYKCARFTQRRLGIPLSGWHALLSEVVLAICLNGIRSLGRSGTGTVNDDGRTL